MVTRIDRILFDQTVQTTPSDQRSFDDRRLHHRAELVAKLDPLVVAHLNEIDCNQVFLRIDPEQRAGIAGPPVLADRPRQPRLTWSCSHLEPKPEPQAGRTPRNAAGMVRSHEFDGLSAEKLRLA